MTNTNDFRRYSYQTDPTTLINSFTYTKGSHAPRVKPEYEEPERKLKLKENKGIKSQAQLLHEQKVSRRRAIRIAAAAVACLMMVGLVLNSFALKNQYTREIADKETAIANAESEYISLQSELGSLVSISMIDKYAVEKLGMSKVRSGQVQYMDVDEYKEQRASKTETKEKKVSGAVAAMAALKKNSTKKSKKNKSEESGNSEASDDRGAEDTETENADINN